MTAGRPGLAPGPSGHPAVTGYCRLVDRLNEFIGWLLGPMIVFVSVAIVSVVSRGVFNRATNWVNESVIYGSSAVYLLVGGYALFIAATCASISCSAWSHPGRDGSWTW